MADLVITNLVANLAAYSSFGYETHGFVASDAINWKKHQHIHQLAYAITLKRTLVTMKLSLQHASKDFSYPSSSLAILAFS